MDGEIVVERRKPRLRMGRAVVTPTPGAFLQPTALGEETLASLAMQAIAGADRVIDLFSGIGTFSLRAAEFAEVLAAAEFTGLPCVIKPVMSSSGKGQSKVESADALEAAWDYAVANMRGDRARVIVEQFIDFDYEIT